MSHACLLFPLATALRSKGAGLLLLTLLALSPCPAGAAPVTVPAAQQQAFQLGFVLQLPTARAEEFIAAVKSLEAVSDDKEAARRIARLADMASALRQADAHSYAQAAHLLGLMSAPPTLHAWATKTAATLRAPLALSEEARPYAKSDPATAAVLATLDEAQAIKTGADDQKPALLAWLKLTRGPEAVWAGDVGALTAGIHVSLVGHEKAHPASRAAQQLAEKAPRDLPRAVKDALESLAPRRGNLAHLTRTKAPSLSPEAMAEAHDTLLDAFHARSLLEAEHPR